MQIEFGPSVSLKRKLALALPTGNLHRNTAINCHVHIVHYRCDNIFIQTVVSVHKSLGLPWLNDLCWWSTISMLAYSPNKKYSTYLSPTRPRHWCHCMHPVPAYLQLLLETGKFLLGSWPSMCIYCCKSHCKPPPKKASFRLCSGTPSYKAHSKTTEIY